MNFNEYQKKTRETAEYPTCLLEEDQEAENVAPVYRELRWIYTALGLAGEAGEVADKFKKIIRDKGGRVSSTDQEAIKLELGDVLWYVAQICDCLDIRMGDVATANISKLAKRKAKGTINGSGDHR